jgi:hypothetical protein
MNENDKARKTFIVRAIIIGAAEMITADALPYSEENIKMIRECIDREFDII